MDSPTMTNPGSLCSSNDDTPRVKFLCSFSGSILPRPQDGKLRYVGGETRIVSVPRDISFEELMAKMREIFEGAMVLKYQQPDEDLDALVSVVNDDDVVNMMEEYDKLGSGDGFTRLRIFLFSHPDQDGSLHFCDGDERDNERRYVDALNSLNESPEYRTAQHNEFQITGPLDDLHVAEQCFNQMNLDGSLHNLRSNDAHMPQINLRHLTIPHMGFAQPQQSVNQRYNEMEAPWSPAYYSPRQPGHLDPRPISDFPNSPSSSRYYSPYPEFQEKSFDRMPEEYSRLQVNHPSLYDHQPQYTDNVLLFPNGPVPDKAGFPGNILHGANTFEGNSICEHCRMTFQRNQPHPDSSWKPGEHSHFDMVNGFHQVANPCAECPPKREMFPVTADANLHHSYYPIEQNDPRCRQSETHSHERGWSVQHQPNARVEDPQIHASGASRLTDHYVVENAASISLSHSNLIDGHQVLAQGLNYEDLRHIRTGRDPVSQVYHDQVVATGSQIHLPSMDDRGVRYGNLPYAYGPDATYQVPQANMPAHSLWRNVQSPSHGGPSYEVANPPQLVNGSASPGFVRGIMENSPRLQAGMENQNSWLDSSQKRMGFDGFSVPEYSYVPAQNMISNAHTVGNQSVHTVEAIQTPGGMHTFATLEDPSLKSDSEPFLGDRPASLNRSGTKLTADMCVSEKESFIRQEVEQLCPSVLVEDSNMCSGTPSEALMDKNPNTPVSLGSTCPESAVKEGGSADTETNPKDRLACLPDQISSVEKVELQSVKGVKAEVQENADSIHEHDTAAKVANENDAELADGHGGLEFDSDDNVNNSKIEPTKAEEEAIEKGLQTIKNEDLEEIRELGSGTYGSVYHGKWKGSDVAIKRIKASCFAGRPSERERLIADFWREALTLSSLHHPNVVSFYGVVRDGPDGSLATVTEFMVNGSLKQFLQKKDRTIDRRKRLIIAMDTAFGMEYLHGKNIVHFDLKCENLLVNMRDPHRPVCKIGDLGLSKVKQHTLVSGGVRGTLPWMAPELLSGKTKVTEKIDVYSFGIVMWELLTGDEPYADMHCASIIGGIVNNTLRPQIPTWCDPEWKALMESCWAPEPAERPSFSEISQKLRTMAAAMNLK
ncbi:RAF-like serine/threonine-protein kinase 20 [Nicotiana tabacum]|uniref:RAF-like serine/threonine-protein kinase 20 n=1 Tax=Nicotiana tabacum TaxID=4097 RepID=UPI003F4EC1CA